MDEKPLWQGIRAQLRETVRRQSIHQFEQARLIDRNPDDPTRPTNSGLTAYQLTEPAYQVLRVYGTTSFEKAGGEFVKAHGRLADAYAKKRKLHKVPVTLMDGTVCHLSPGKHNKLQKLIIEEFAPRFTTEALVVYLGDTADKYVICETDFLTAMNIPLTQHDKLPDVILFDKKKEWLFLIEAVTSHGPISPKRYHELADMFAQCPHDRVYVTAFLTFKEFRKYAGDIAWESEVWLAESPDHMIHYDGEKFLGPYKES